MTAYKLRHAIDMWVQRVDPAAVRRTTERAKTRDITIGDPDDHSGLTGVWGRLLSTDAALLAQRLHLMADGVCSRDGRTQAQRRADALGALAAGSMVLQCRCGDASCTDAGVDDGRATRFTVHIVTEQPDTADVPGPGLLTAMTGSVIPPALLQDMLARGARRKTVYLPTESENRYRPSAGLDTVIRLRDLTCRHPGCDRPAVRADLDHTIAYPSGPTHPGNLKAYCRLHHLRKTFWPGWHEHQDADGTLHVTSPTGHRYTTKPLGALLFPALRSGPYPPPPKQVTTAPPTRTGKMPTRSRTRAQTRAHRITTERANNRANIGGDDIPF